MLVHQKRVIPNERLAEDFVFVGQQGPEILYRVSDFSLCCAVVGQSICVQFGFPLISQFHCKQVYRMCTQFKTTSDKYALDFKFSVEFRDYCAEDPLGPQMNLNPDSYDRRAP